MPKVIHKIAAMVIENNKFLMVRKVGTNIWTSLGGKPEGTETETEALIRETNEEIGCGAEIIKKLGDFEAPAVHDAGCIVRLSVYLVVLKGKINLQDPELEQCDFIGQDYLEKGISLPPTITDHVIPFCLKNGLLEWQEEKK